MSLRDTADETFTVSEGIQLTLPFLCMREESAIGARSM
jgi:hypothetical protein